MRAFFPLLLLCFACSSAVPAASTTPITLQPQTPEPSLHSSAAGDRAFLTLAIRPHALAPLGQALRGFVPSIFSVITDKIASGVLFDEWLAGVTRGSRQGEVPGVLSWRGLDLERPIYIRVGEAPDDLSAVFGAMDGQLSSFRHVMALPVTDAAALKRSLAPFVAGCRHEQNSYACDSGRVDFVDHDRWLFVALRPLSLGQEQELSPRQDLDGRALMGQLNDAEYWALHGDSPIAGLIRAAPIRGAAVYHAGGMLSRVLGGAAPGNVNQIQTAGTADLVGAFVHAARYGREVDTWAFAVQTDPLFLSVAGVLSEVGAERYRAEPGSDSVPTMSAPIVVRSSNDLAALVSSAPSPMAYQGFGTNHSEVQRAFRACGKPCTFRRLFEPAGYLSMSSEGRSLHELMNGNVRFEVHSNLPNGTIDVDAELSELIPLFFSAGMRLAVRSRVEGGLWAGGVALSAEAAEQGLAHAQTCAASVPPAQGDGDPASLRCLIALGSQTAAALTALARMEGRFVTAVERMREELTQQAQCVSDPSHAAERDGYLRSFELGVPLADLSH